MSIIIFVFVNIKISNKDENDHFDLVKDEINKMNKSNTSH